MVALKLHKILHMICAMGFILIVNVLALSAQQTESAAKHIYRPNHALDTIKTIVPDSSVQIPAADSLARAADSLARAMFVRDSIERRQRMLDSVVFLKSQLQRMMEAYFSAIKEEIIPEFFPIPIIGDSTLGNFSYTLLPFGVRDPYTPWRGHVVLSGKAVRYTVDQKQKRIVGIKAPQVSGTFSWIKNGRALVIEEAAVIQKNLYGNFFKKPVDTVFFDAENRIIAVKKYVVFHALGNGNTCGALLFTNRTQLKNYEYGTGGKLTQYKLMRYCDRWKVYEANKLCSTITYSLTHSEGTCQVSRKNEPSNVYSDGTFTFVFDKPGNLKCISFQNTAKTENWTRDIELNKDGFVNCYMDKANNVIVQSLCWIYHKEANAKYPVEEILTTFEKDGISYIQKNNTTGKVRTRDRMTLEWSPWR